MSAPADAPQAEAALERARAAQAAMAAPLAAIGRLADQRAEAIAVAARSMRRGDIAAALGVSVGAVDKALHRTRARNS